MLKRLLAPCSIIRIQTWDSKAIVSSTVEEVVGVTWPHRTGAVATGRAKVICVGPTDWLVVDTEPDANHRPDRLAAAFDGSTFRATNVSDVLARIEIEGAAVRDLLAKGCSIDLHPALFPPGRSARTRFAGMPVILCCRGDSKFELIVTSSYLDFLLVWLADATLEFEAVT